MQMSAAVGDTATALATRLAAVVNANMALEVTAAVDGPRPNA
jgi:phage tail sheath gpL-like